MESATDVEELRMRLWERFLALRDVHGETISFDQFWYEFLVRFSITDSASDSYEGICRDLENRTN
jgi:hypothetical protein